APRAVLIDRHGRILYVNGDLDAYLTYHSGVPSDDLLTKARSGLRGRLRIAVGKAFAENRNVSVTCRVRREDKDFGVRVHVRLLADNEREDPLALVLFEDLPEVATSPRGGNEDSLDLVGRERAAAEAIESSIDESTIIGQLEDELSAVKDDLQLTVEQFETSQEEFKACNEEVMSINEELQSANEELETSKEELQSLNEELSTVNQQLAGKIEELERKHADLENLIAATNIATICLDSELSIRWFTEAAKQVIRIKTSDQGRPLNDLAHDFGDDSLVEDCQRVLRDLVPVECEIGCHDGRAFIRRVVPFRAEDRQVGGVVITLMDITTQRRREAELRASEERFRRALSVEGIGVLFFDPAGKLLDCNEWFLQATGYQRSDVAAGKITSLGMTPPEWVDATCDQLEKLRSTGRIGPYEKELICKNGSRLWMMLSGSSLEDGTVVVHCIDVHDRKRAEQSLQNLNRTLEQQVAQRTELMSILQHVTRVANEARSVDEAMRAALMRICQYDGWKVGRVWQSAREGSDPIASRSIWHVEADAMQAIDRLVEFQRRYDQTLASSDTGLVAAVLQSAQPVWFDDIAQSDPWRQQMPGLGVHAAVAFPITIDGAVVAVMEFFSDQPSRPQSRFMEIVPDVGIQLGHVIRRKRLEYLVARVANEEQRRIGRELHDGISQQLTGGTMIAESLRQKLADEESPHSMNARHLVQILKETHADVRQLSNGLLPSTLDSAHLRPALCGLLREVSDRFSVPIEIDDQGFDETVIDNDATAFLVYQICREAVHNAIKHACPNHIRVRLVTDPDFCMTVEDDGKGFDTADVTKQANGLPIMTYRAESVGGTLRIESAEQVGTKVVLTIPRSGCKS
ncbi:MAG: PAS domain-containing protein, partial [Planctomycetaceae bacterium]